MRCYYRYFGHESAPAAVRSLKTVCFAVFAENEQNAFYILTPQVMEQITAFQEAMEGNVYLSFSEKSLYVTCSQLRNPFHIYIDIPVEEQRQKIADDTAILRSAKEILIRAGQSSPK